MVTDGRWKLVRYYQRDEEQPPEDLWYDLVHPFGERREAVPPRPALRDLLIQELDGALSTLVTDLENKKLLDKTLIVVASEFGRPAQFDAAPGETVAGGRFTMRSIRAG